ncbi:MAG: FtsX-like permease family protein [Bryobacteraceae bacterium]|jgi:ABC-type antimicrobial peptide transport system permease subunit
MVVGVVPDILQNDFSQGEPRVYLPYRQEPQLSVFLAARTGVPPVTLGPAFRRAVQDLDSNLPVYDLRSLDEHVALHHLDMRMFTVIFSAFAGIALLLASIGLSAVVAHSVSQRTHELGVRMALGASAMRICGLVFARGMSQLAAGLAVGVLLALSVTRVLGTLLVGTQSDDPLTLLLTTAVLSAAGVLGCAIPARRAMRVDPLAALRNE